MNISGPADTSLPQYQSHPRGWRRNHYVYPVISRRSAGLSIGVNLNPNKACNFACVYCQVDRSPDPRTRGVDPARVGEELTRMIDDAKSGVLFDDPAFADVPAGLRGIKDISFSGDGEPTTCKQFRECVELVAAIKREAGLGETGIVLITDACYLRRPQVQAGLAILDVNNGSIWAKLDAGTEAYFRKVNRPNFPLRDVISNIIAAAQIRPIVIQSIFMHLHGKPPDEAELLAYVDRLNEITYAGGRIDYVQIYTIARPPAENYVTALTNQEVDRITDMVRTRTSLHTEPFYGAGE